MKSNKYKAFTIAELMIILAILVIVMAAFAPVFTVRYNNASAENVWAFVPNDDQYDAYYDQINKSMTAQAFIGVTPANKSDITNFKPYSKVVIRPTDKRSKQQAQIQFRYGNNSNGTGSLTGELFANKTNILFGGMYKQLETSAYYNTSYGAKTLNSISRGSYNTALGYNSLGAVYEGNNNTAIGYNSGSSITSGANNTILGAYGGTGLKSGSYNTVIGDQTKLSSSSSSNTIVGTHAANSVSGTFNGNTAVGAYSLKNATSGQYNTAVGAYSLNSLTQGGYNTAVGYNACADITGSYKTCVGYNAGKFSSAYDKKNDLYADTKERVYIGTPPYEFYRGTGHLQDSLDPAGAAVLEVHNLNTKNSASVPFGNVGNSSVVVNGNLIVRGQTYLTGKASLYNNRPALMMFFLGSPKNRTHGDAFAGLDGSNRTEKVRGNRNRLHAQQGGRLSCVCAIPTNDTTGRTSYDWATQQSAQNTSDSWRYGGSYVDKSTGASIKLSGNDHNATNIDLNYAHMYSNGSCCPDLKSDIRLKDLESVYTAGLDEINRLKVYNYTYKNDPDKFPHVGVIAQDLKRVFPTAVTKGEDGYYRIRWDEMFYAAINAIKTINSKVEALASRVAKDQARIAALKQDNAKLEQKVDLLAKELTKLEQNK